MIESTVLLQFTGQNVYGVVRAPRAASTEAIVVSVPYRPINSVHPTTAPSVALLLAFAQYCRRTSVLHRIRVNSIHFTPHVFFWLQDKNIGRRILYSWWLSMSSWVCRPGWMRITESWADRRMFCSQEIYRDEPDPYRLPSTWRFTPWKSVTSTSRYPKLIVINWFLFSSIPFFSLYNFDYSTSCIRRRT